MTDQAPATHLYPLFLKLAGRHCLVVGGGKVAERKAAGLLEAGADVTVISPQASERLRGLAQQGRIAWRQKTFTVTDLEGEFLAVAATDDQAVNTSIAAVCRARGILVNVVDEPDLCDFLVPAVLRRGPLAVAISTGGASPLFARRLRCEIEQIVTEPYGEFMELMGRQRDRIKNMEPDPRKREAMLQALIEADILDLLKAGKRAEAQERIEQCISSQPG